MPAPPAGKILYQFTPPTDDWLGSYCEPSYYVPPQLCSATRNLYGYLSYASLADEYDFRAWSTTAGGPSPPMVYFYKQHVNLGWVHRIKFTFSLSVLPQSGRYTYMGPGLSYSNTSTDNPIYPPWSINVNAIIWSTGQLSTTYGADVIKSTNTISAATSYNAEIYAFNDPSQAHPKVQIYIDDDLWVEETQYVWPSVYSRPYAQCTAGWKSRNDSYGPFDYTLHMENIIWTMEGPGYTGWTMMAP